MGGRLERFAVVVATAAVLAINALAGAGHLNDVSTGEVARRFDLPFTPAGYAFAIWGLIYLGLVTFAVAQSSAAGARSGRAAAIRPAYLFSSVANGAWLWFWHHEALLASLAIMALLLGALAFVYRTLAGAPPMRGEIWWLDGPFSLYCAWITVATLANLAAALGDGRIAGIAPDPVLLSQVMLGIVLAIAVFAYRQLCDPLFLGVIAWACAAIALKAGQPPVVSAPAMLVGSLAGLAGIGLLLESAGREPAQSRIG